MREFLATLLPRTIKVLFTVLSVCIAVAVSTKIHNTNRLHSSSLNAPVDTNLSSAFINNFTTRSLNWKLGE